MSERSDVSILSISQYGAGLLSEHALSGALERQKDYAATLTKYIVIVPGNVRVIKHGTALEIHGVKSANVFSFCFNAYKAAVLLHREFEFDGVMVDNPHLGGILGIVLKYRLGIPLVVHSMADMIYNPWYTRERFSNHLKHMLMLIAVRCADFIRVSTQTEINRLTEKGIARAKLHLMYFYIDAHMFGKRLEGCSDARIDGRILFVGRLSYQKDIGTLIRAMVHVRKKNPDAKLVLLGGGELRGEYESLARSLSVHESIIFTGSIPYEQVPREFKKASLFALSSLYEGTCMVLHEAAVAGLPLVSTDVAGAHDFIREGVEGRLVPVRDAEALGSALSWVLGNKEAGVQMGEAARVRVEHFKREQALLSWQELCRKVKNKRGVKAVSSSV